MTPDRRQEAERLINKLVADAEDLNAFKAVALLSEYRQHVEARDQELVRLRAEVRALAEEMQQYCAQRGEGVGWNSILRTIKSWADLLAVLGREK